MQQKDHDISIGSFFRTDHDRLYAHVEELFTGIPSEDPTHQKLVRALRNEFLNHLYWEEQYLFPALKQHVPNIQTIMDQIGKDHEQIRTFLSKVQQKIRKASSDCQIDVQSFQSLLSHHFTKEEKFLFPRMEKEFTNQKKQQIFHRIKQEWNAQK